MLGLLTFLTTLNIIGSLFYYTIGLTPVVVGVIAAGTIFYLITRVRRLPTLWQSVCQSITEQKEFFTNRPYLVVLSFTFLGLLITVITILATHPITDAVRSPWDRIPTYFFLVFFLTALAGIVLLFRLEENPSRTPSIIISALLLSPFLFVAIIVFPLGYGFDSFIHQATEKLIATTGTVTPKPFYYIGQYSLVVLLSKFLFIPVVWVDKLLVPVLTVILIPWSIMRWWNQNTSPFPLLAGGSLIGILLLPFFLNEFTITTPQAFANLLLIILIFLETWSVKRGVLWFIAFAILLTHPLAGIPAFIFLILSSLHKKNRLLLIAYCLLTTIAIPIAFLLAAQLSSQIHVTFTPQNFLPWLQSIEWSGIYRENRFHAPFDLLYFYAFNVKNIFWFFVITAFMVAPRLRSGTKYIQCFLVLLASYILMSGFLAFEFLIGYEQADYALRVLEIAQLFMLPFFLIGFSWWVGKIWNLKIACLPARQGNWKLATQASSVVVLSLLLTASLYLTYPQNVDSYSVSHAFNTSQSDIETVQWIEANAEGEPYVVLANQAVSAAAVREFGFKKYFGSSYFYPIPTGSPLYQNYLDMVYKNASRETMYKAMDLVGTDRAYFVLNRYWVNFARIKKEASASADTFHSINDQDFIFEYHR